MITVITPAFNGERFIADAIESVLSQTVVDFEYLIVDDGSTDRTATIAREYAARDVRVRVLSNLRNSGVYHARNEGLKHAHGRYVAFLDADDVWEPRFLAKTLEEIERSDVGAVFTWSLNFGEDVGTVVDAPREGNYDFRDLFLGICPPRNGSCLLIDRRCFAAVGSFLTTFRVGADAEMWLRISSRCSSTSLRRFRCISDVLVRRRVVSNSLTADFFSQERLKAWTYRLETYLPCLPHEQQFEVLFVHVGAVARIGKHDCARWLDRWKRIARRTYRDELVRRSLGW